VRALFAGRRGGSFSLMSLDVILVFAFEYHSVPAQLTCTRDDTLMPLLLVRFLCLRHKYFVQSHPTKVVLAVPLIRLTEPMMCRFVRTNGHNIPFFFFLESERDCKRCCKCKHDNLYILCSALQHTEVLLLDTLVTGST
jgi:hypothetical protein